MTKHTPTPWIHSKDGTLVYTSGDAPFGYKLIIPSGPGHWMQNEIKANASFIVRAVNAHEDLLACTKNLLAILENTPDSNIFLKQRCKQAITKAKE